MPSAYRRSRIRAPINSSIAFELFGEAFFALAFFTALLAVDNLKKAIAVGANVSISVRMYRRIPGRHENPIFALYVRRQPRSWHCRQAQRAVGRSAINVVRNSGGHQMTIAMQPIATITFAV